MNSPETPNNQQADARRDVTVSVPEHRADQFLALSRRVLAVWEYRDAYGEPGRRGGHRRGRGRGFAGHRHGRCAERGQGATSTAGGTVETA
jgi:hypothetical protein